MIEKKQNSIEKVDWENSVLNQNEHIIKLLKSIDGRLSFFVTIIVIGIVITILNFFLTFRL
jgi:hypothetical protein